VLFGEAQMVEPELTGDFATVMEWADGARRLKVRANADGPKDADVAVKFGAEGIGLCRTEHMFFDPARIVSVRKMIIAETEAARTKALGELFPHQRADFVGIFKAMAGRPVTIRTLDLGADKEVQALAGTGRQATNPALGLRAIRYCLAEPQIFLTQLRAILRAAHYGNIRVLIPMLAHVAEAQGVVAAETIAGADTMPVEYDFIPRATYCHPQIGSFGYSEAQAKEKGYDVKTAVFPFAANGKAAGLGETAGFVKVIADASHNEILGAAMIGPDVTELLPVLTLAQKWDLTADEVARNVFAHPTLSESVKEAVEGIVGHMINF
jgi:hypothetical protein